MGDVPAAKGKAEHGDAVLAEYSEADVTGRFEKRFLLVGTVDDEACSAG